MKLSGRKVLPMFMAEVELSAFRIPRSEPGAGDPECGEVDVMSSAEPYDPAVDFLSADERDMLRWLLLGLAEDNVFS